MEQTHRQITVYCCSNLEGVKVIQLRYKHYALRSKHHGVWYRLIIQRLEIIRGVSLVIVRLMEGETCTVMSLSINICQHTDEKCRLLSTLCQLPTTGLTKLFVKKNTMCIIHEYMPETLYLNRDKDGCLLHSGNSYLYQCLSMARRSN